MDFFGRQEQARHKTKLLIVYFVLAITLLVLSTYLVLAAVFLRHHYNPANWYWLWDPELFGAVGAGTLFVVFFGSLYKMLELRRGGDIVATHLGGRLISHQTTDLDEKKILNVVEEMAIASGVPVPEVYLLPDESAINAFAAGYTPSDAVIGVTQGSVKLLSRDELQGVMGHEFSHILNGDMRLNLRLIGLINGLLCIALIGRFLLRFSFVSGRSRSGGRGDNRGGNPLPLVGLVLLVIGFLGVFFGRLIKSAVSRQREFLADASSVQFTRNPSGIASALKKIGGLLNGSRLKIHTAEEASHLFFGNALKASWFGLLSTHPPLVDRIRAIEPTFDGKFPQIVLPAPPPPVEQKAPLPPRPAMGPFTGVMAPAILAGAAVSQAGQPLPEHLALAVELKEAWPEPLKDAAHQPLGAVAVVYGLLLDADPARRARQWEQLSKKLEPAVAQETQRLIPLIWDAEVPAKLPLASLALPALRQLSPTQYRDFKRTVQTLIEWDQQLDLFEFTLQKMVLRHLAPRFETVRKPVVQFYVLRPLVDDCAVLISALARIGTQSAEEAEQCFRTGAQHLPQAATALTLKPIEECRLDRIDRALSRIAQASPRIKQWVLNACASAAATNQKLEVEEAEMLRAIADTLDCPIPPFLEFGKAGKGSRLEQMPT